MTRLDATVEPAKSDFYPILTILSRMRPTEPNIVAVLGPIENLIDGFLGLLPGGYSWQATLMSKMDRSGKRERGKTI
jgi:hypothetical protein